MYHYVRPLAEGRFPRIKGMDLEVFDRQLDWLSERFRFPDKEEVFQSLRKGRVLPGRCAVLTFDDGLLDHYLHVFPRLRRRGISGWFFPPVQAVAERKMLPVHQIHQILDHVSNSEALMQYLWRGFRKVAPDWSKRIKREWKQGCTITNRFDSAETTFFKRVLQFRLPRQIRNRLVDELWREVVGLEEWVASREWYLDREQLNLMLQDGMAVGGHGNAHEWLEHLSEAEQRNEIRATRHFLSSLDGALIGGEWAMAYPYGSYNEATLSIMKSNGGKIGFTTKVGVSQMLPSALAVPRLDTNDLPPQARSSWKKKFPDLNSRKKKSSNQGPL